MSPIPYLSRIKAIAPIVLVLAAVAPCLFAHGLIDDQIAEITRQLDDNPGDRALLLRRAELHRAHDDYNSAKSDLQSILSSPDANPLAALTLARLERERGLVDSAVEALTDYFKWGGDAPEAWRESALIQTALARPQKSAAAWTKYLDLANAPTADEFHAAATSHLNSAAPEYALQIIETGLQKFPRSIPLQQCGASIRIGSSDHPSAERVFASLRRQYPALLPRLRYEEGKIWESHNEPGKAMSAYNLALQRIGELPAGKQSTPGLRRLHKDLIDKLDP